MASLLRAALWIALIGVGVLVYLANIDTINARLADQWVGLVSVVLLYVIMFDLRNTVGHELQRIRNLTSNNRDVLKQILGELTLIRGELRDLHKLERTRRP